MPDRTRIAVCRGAFLVLCVVPTLLTCGFIAFHWLSATSPAAKAEWERELSLRLGVAVAIDGLSYPRPGLAELAGVTLADPETKLPLGDCSRVEIERRKEAWQVTLVEPSIGRGALPALVRRLHERAGAAAATEAPPIRISATQLTLEGGEAPHSLTNVSAQWDSAASGPALALQFALPADEQTIELRVTRSQQVTPPATQIEWDVPEPLPVSLAALFVPELAELGSQATVSGSGRLLWEPGNLRGQLAGEVRGIDLSRLVGERFPHILTGQADLKLDEATLDGGRLASARGTLATSGGGRISRSLAAAAAEHLALVAELPPDEEESATYRKLALHFELSDQGLHLAGGDHSHAALVTTDAGPLLAAPEGHQVPAVALVRTLVPDSRVQVPATKQTAALLRFLPLPAVEPSDLARKSSHTPTRLGPASPADRSANPIREGSLR